MDDGTSQGLEPTENEVLQDTLPKFIHMYIKDKMDLNLPLLPFNLRWLQEGSEQGRRIRKGTKKSLQKVVAIDHPPMGIYCGYT